MSNWFWLIRDNKLGNSRVTVPLSLRRVLIPFVKSLISGTWAYTLFPMIRSALLWDFFTFFAVSYPKNFIKVSIPFLSAIFAVPSVGSIPIHGTLQSLK